ncbi:Aldo/keto reductase [Bimuria novae-zelandiae CBS 107.79]|uniref:Aldo/keto reductase n=1 Tax=Bimuria novae-zelandiae CBS 107.79 TaxID=1447943 RepID=A0A6A5V2W3_9PLEO|nr:Aldo/keto reductase [Bimuria novae-zelandiae CBS 107.79]
MASKLHLTSTLPLPKSCLTAFKAGYRHIDTAQYYANESSVGEAIRDSKIARKDIDATYKSIEESVNKLAGEGGYVDLFLIHSPNGGKESRTLLWQALEMAKDRGKVRDIGVSNYGIAHIEETKDIGKIWPPTVNQIELHPWCQQREIVEHCKNNSVVVEAYCPIVRNQKADDKTLNEIANKHKTSPNQVLIRYCLEKGWVPLPKSDTPERIEKNANVFGFELDDKDIKSLDGLDQGNSGAIVQAVSNSSR